MNTIGVRRVPKTGARGGERERGSYPIRMGVGWLVSSPEKKFKYKMSVEAILIHFETNFACEILYRQNM